MRLDKLMSFFAALMLLAQSQCDSDKNVSSADEQVSPPISEQIIAGFRVDSTTVLTTDTIRLTNDAEPFHVRLPVKLTTGRTWSVVQLDSTVQVLRQDSIDYTGPGETQVFTLTAQVPPATEVIFVERRNFATDSLANSLHRLKIHQ